MASTRSAGSSARAAWAPCGSASTIGLGTRVAIKFIRPQFAERADARRRFEIEARAAASVDSKHAVKVYDYGVTDDGPAVHRHGVPRGRVALRGAHPPRARSPTTEAAKVIRQAARALTKAHAASIVHRDLKPDNIFLATNVESADSDGLPYVVKLVDFGIAKMLDADREGAARAQGPDAGRLGHRHAELHEPRAAHGRRNAEPAHGHLVARRVHLRRVHRAHPVRGRGPRRHRAQGLRRAAARAEQVEPRRARGARRVVLPRLPSRDREALPDRRGDERVARRRSVASAW